MTRPSCTAIGKYFAWQLHDWSKYTENVTEEAPGFESVRLYTPVAGRMKESYQDGGVIDHVFAVTSLRASTAVTLPLTRPSRRNTHPFWSGSPSKFRAHV